MCKKCSGLLTVDRDQYGFYQRCQPCGVHVELHTKELDDAPVKGYVALLRAVFRDESCSEALRAVS